MNEAKTVGGIGGGEEYSSRQELLCSRGMG